MMTRILAKGYLWLLLALLYSPILIIMVFSFTEAKVLGNWTGFSTKLYSSLFTGGMHHSLTSAIWNTFAIAMLAATASTALGSIAAIGIFNLRTRTRRVMNFANAIPMMNADIITGVSLFLLFVSCGISQGFTTVVLAHITFCTPYVVLSVMPRLKKMNQNVYEAALDLGATPFQALRKVILPEILPGMISGFILAFTLSIDDFAVTIFTIGNEGLETLSTYIYADARKGGLTPELRPVSNRRVEFSTTTMASSTTMATANISPNNVKVLIEKPNNDMIANVPISETGIVIQGMMTARQFCRKRKITSTTNSVVSKKVTITSSMDAWITSVVSSVTLYCTPAGKFCDNSCIFALTPVDTSSELLPGCW